MLLQVSSVLNLLKLSRCKGTLGIGCVPNHSTSAKPIVGNNGNSVTLQIEAAIIVRGKPKEAMKCKAMVEATQVEGFWALFGCN